MRTVAVTSEVARVVTTENRHNALQAEVPFYRETTLPKLRFVLAFVAMIIFSSSAMAGLIVYNANIDPANPTYNAYASEPGITPWTKEVLTTTGTGVMDGSTPAWKVDDGGDNSWKLSLTAADAAAVANGWTMAAKVKMSELVVDVVQYRVAFESQVLGDLWRMDFRNAGDNWMLVRINGYAPQEGNYLPLDSLYHEYKLVYDPTTLTADFYIDNLEKVSNIPQDATAVTQNRIYWGDMSGGATGAGLLYVNAISLATDPVPEPGALTLLGLGLIAPCVYGRRRQK